MHTIVAIPFDERLADYIGKKGSENSMTFYNRKLTDNVIIGIMPSSIEEKFYALPQSLLIADQVLVSTASLDRLFGEVLVACALLNKKTVFTKDNDATKILSGITLENIAFADQSELLDMLISYKSGRGPKDARVDIDKAFNVKGVGTVILGVVTSGTIKVHDSLYHSSGRIISIRSIQSQDEDIKEAEAGTRVGLAVRGADEGDIKKGDILSIKQIKACKNLELDIRKSNFVDEVLEIGKMYSIAIGFSYVVSTIEKIEGSKITFKLEKSIPVETGDRCMIVRAIVPRMFASGIVTKAD